MKPYTINSIGTVHIQNFHPFFYLHRAVAGFRKYGAVGRAELEGILTVYANHPSFVMLSFGNELQASEAGHGRMRNRFPGIQMRLLDSSGTAPAEEGSPSCPPPQKRLPADNENETVHN